MHRQLSKVRRESMLILWPLPRLQIGRRIMQNLSIGKLLLIWWPGNVFDLQWRLPHRLSQSKMYQNHARGLDRELRRLQFSKYLFILQGGLFLKQWKLWANPNTNRQLWSRELLGSLSPMFPWVYYFNWPKELSRRPKGDQLSDLQIDWMWQLLHWIHEGPQFLFVSSIFLRE